MRGRALELARRLPKTELHLHLDGSLTPEWILGRMRERGLPHSFASADDLADRVRDRDRTSMGSSLSIFDLFAQVLQTDRELHEATESVCQRLASSNVAYAELRLCPELHTREGLSAERVVSVVDSAMRGAGMRGGVLVCALRSLGADHAMHMARLAASSPALGFDVAGNEQDYPLAGHRAALDYCSAHGVPATVHAGEWAGTEHNLRLALEQDCVRRIGHGIQLARHPPLVELARSRGVHVECCLTANVGGGKVASYAEHPIRNLISAGVSVSLSSDNLLASGSRATGGADPVGETVAALERVGLTEEQVVACALSGVDAAFCAESDKEGVKASIREAAADLGVAV